MRPDPDAIEASLPGDHAVALLASEVRRLQAVITQLRSSASHISDDGNTLADAAEIEQLREAICRLADQDATLSVQGGSVTVTLDATLADAEREAIERAMNGYVAWMEDNVCFDTPEVQAVLYRLRGLLERTK